MRTPVVAFSPDDTIKEFLRKVVGTSTQDVMIGSEVLFGAGLVSRELTLLDGRLTIHFRAGPGLQSRLKALSNTGRAEWASRPCVIGSA